MQKNGEQMKSERWRVVVRAVAFGFLLFAVTDLTFASWCQEDSAPLFAAPAPQPAMGHTDVPHESEQHPASTEDCFCCCSHIVSEDLSAPLGAPALLSVPHETARPSVPAAPVRHLFRPPRLG
jgi:hypothetical protein